MATVSIVWKRIHRSATIENARIDLLRHRAVTLLATVPQRTILEALEVIRVAEDRLGGARPGSNGHRRLSAVIIELQQVVSMLSDAAHQTPDAVLRGRETVDAARQVIAELQRDPTDDSDVNQEE